MVFVKSIESLKTLNFSISKIVDITTDEIRVSVTEIREKLNEIQDELSISQNLLEVSIQKEIYTKSLLASRITEHLQAEARLASAIASSNPIEISIASSDVTETAYKVHIAEEEYEEATQSRIRMEDRIELVNRSYQTIENLLEKTESLFNDKLYNLTSQFEILTTRLTHGYSNLESYLFQSYNKLDIPIQQHIISERYEYSLLKHKQGKITQKELNEAYINKLESSTFRVSKYAEEEGVEISKYGLPKFKSEIDTSIQSKDFEKSREYHFRVCNRYLKNRIEDDEEFRSKFSKRELQQIQIGKTPEGYTWHHDGNPPPGRMQLVKSKQHDRVRHDGGYSLWKKRK